MEPNEIKQILKKVCGRNVKMLEGRIRYYEKKRDATLVAWKRDDAKAKRLDEKIRLTLVKDLFAELKIAFNIED